MLLLRLPKLEENLIVVLLQLPELEGYTVA